MKNLAVIVLSPDFFYMWIRVATPLLLPALGAMVCNQAGVVNLGLEGIMLSAALFGALGGAFGGSILWGLAMGLGISLLLSLVFAYVHLNLRANNVLCGTAINTFASGFTVFLLELFAGEKGTSSSLKSFSFPQITIPLIGDIPVVGRIVSGHNLLTYSAVLAVFLTSFLLYKTPLGIRIRTVGENEYAAASVGISVNRVRFIAILICGLLTGLGGMYLSTGYLNFFTRDMTAGRGFIALAAAPMGQNTPLGVLCASLIFAFFDGLSNILQVLRIPSEFVQMLPYFATILGITVYSIQRARAERFKRRIRSRRERIRQDLNY